MQLRQSVLAVQSLGLYRYQSPPRAGPSRWQLGRSCARSRSLTVLALESSADDSCCAIVDSDRRIHANVVIKQHMINAKYGGIHPLRAQEGHTAGVPLAIAQALRQAQMKVDDVDAVAYTRGPGIHACLSVGADAAKALAAASGKPVYGIHHMQAHALTPLLTEESPPEFPFLALLVSGGHTQLVLARGLSDFQIMATTMDTCIGDAFEKVARGLDILPSPDCNPGALLEEQAGLPALPPYDSTPMPRFTIPLSSLRASRGGRAFSFTGLSSNSMRAIAQEKEKGVGDEAIMREVAKRFQEGAVGHLTQQIRRMFMDDPSPKLADAASIAEGQNRSPAPHSIKGVKRIVVSGGVASNMYLREQLEKLVAALPAGNDIKLYYPPVALCTDNAAMIAWAAILRIQAGASPEGYDLHMRHRWSLEALYDDLPA